MSVKYIYIYKWHSFRREMNIQTKNRVREAGLSPTELGEGTAEEGNVCSAHTGPWGPHACTNKPTAE